MCAEKFAGTCQQRPYLIELVLQQRVSHAGDRISVRGTAQFTVQLA